MGESWPADSVERVSVNSLVPYARNARTHSDSQVAQIAASVREWGWTTPVLVDENNQIIAGHGRILAAERLGITEVPVMKAANWTESQKRAYILADNQLAQNAGWDIELLKLEFNDLSISDFDVELIGFHENFVSEFLLDPDFDPGTEDDQGKLDSLDPKMTTCPHCGEEYDLREQE